MKFNKYFFPFLFLFSIIGFAGAREVPPGSLSIYGIYGMPIEPLSLASQYSDGVGFSALGEVNPCSNISLGFSYEHAAFYSSTDFVTETFNFEARTFPFGNWRQNFQPYFMAGVGINAAPDMPGRWDGRYDYVMGLGSKVLFVSPIYLDIAIQSHWMEPASDYFQYLDARFGISWSFPNMKEEPTPEPTASPTPTSSVTAVFTPTPTQAPVVSSSGAVTVQLETPLKPKLTNEEIMAEYQGGGGGSKMLKYYKKGMKAFTDLAYLTATKNLKLAVSTHEKSVARAKYAEAYAILGVIYQFHKPITGHNLTALAYYKKALSLDPSNKAANKYIKILRAQLKPKKKPKPKPVPRNTEDSYQSPASPNNTTLP